MKTFVTCLTSALEKGKSLNTKEVANGDAKGNV